MLRVRRSFLVEAMGKIFRFQEKKSVYSLVLFKAKYWKSKAKQK
jgi:hypothetical protein